MINLLLLLITFGAMPTIAFHLFKEWTLYNIFLGLPLLVGPGIAFSRIPKELTFQVDLILFAVLSFGLVTLLKRVLTTKTAHSFSKAN